MQYLPDTTESNSDGYIEGQSNYFEESSGWETNFKKEDTGNLIRLANNKIKIIQLLDLYKIKLETIYSPSGWTQRGRCPFPDHRDSSPSFGVNPEDNIFNCFGCGKRGSTVQFKAGMDKISSRMAAEILLDSYGVTYDVLEIEEEKNSSKVDLILLEFSNFVRNCDKDSKLIESVTWSLDIYIQKHINDRFFDEEKILTRIELLKEKLL